MVNHRSPTATENYKKLKDKFDERMAYEIANGKVMANPLVDQEGKINLVRLKRNLLRYYLNFQAMDFEDHESEDSYISDGSLESYNSDDDEPKEVFVDPMSAPPGCIDKVFS